MDTTIFGNIHKQAGVFTALTGINDWESIQPKDLEINKVINIIEKYIENDWIITCGTYSFNEDVKKSTGIAPNHTYSVIGFIKLSKKFDKKIILRLRNPWGDFEWKGKFSDT